MTATAEKPTATAAKTPWNLTADYIETCNCDPGCNCNFAGFPDHEKCEAAIGMVVTKGRHGDVDLAGLKVVMAVRWPKAIHEGHGEAALFVDEPTTDAQLGALGSILTGQSGGLPWEILATTIEKLHDPVRTKLEIKVDGRRSSFRVPGVIEAELTPLKNPVTGEESEVHIVFPKGGLIWNDGDTATTAKMSVNYKDMKYEHAKQSAFFTQVNWSNKS